MARIVGAFAMSHQLGSPDGVEAQSERVFQGMREIGRRIRALSPSVLLIVSSDHLNNFSLTRPTPFAVGTAERFTPLGDMGLPRDPVPGAPAFARDFIAFAREAGVEISAVDPLRPDHGVMIPLGIIDPERRIPAVPLYVNTIFYPEPTPADSRRLGETIRDYVDMLGSADRVVLVGAGGLSHWVGTPEEGTINEAWDHDFIDDLAERRIDALAARSNQQILVEAGNGGLEVNAWIAVAAALPGATTERIFYEPIQQWATGMAGVQFHLAA